jgi:predicted Zn finger-like uncharacterized protein
MKLTCPKCAAVYDVPDGAIGPNGRKVRCLACATSWVEPPRADPKAPGGAMPSTLAAPAPEPEPRPAAEPPVRRGRGPWLLLALVILVVVLGVVAASLAFGPREVAARFGLADQRVPLGIAISREPDWRMIADGGQLFAVSGRIWNPTGQTQPVPDIRAELKDDAGKVVYAWTITRPVARLGPGASTPFDGAAVDVPASSSHISVSFAGADAR